MTHTVVIRPELQTAAALAAALGRPAAQLRYWAFIANALYRYTNFSIPKKSGGTRDIHAPCAVLKEIHRELLEILQVTYRARSTVHGFVRTRSIVTNAIPHVGARFIANIDLKNFFPSINFGRVRGVLMANPVWASPEVATLIARLVCHQNELPQGSPLSPLIANLVCGRMDGRLRQLARNHNCRYSRYADDLTFSTRQKSFPTSIVERVREPHGTQATVGAVLEQCIGENGFVQNEKKVRIYDRQNTQVVTGLIVNTRVNVRRQYVRQVRAMLHAWERFGLKNAEDEYVAKYQIRHRSPRRGKPAFSNVVRGKILFLAMVRGWGDPLVIRLAKRCRNLDPKSFGPILDKYELLQQSVWVLESSTGTGTAFFLDGVGLVTCNHVVSEDTEAFHPDRPAERYPVKVISRHGHIDLAVLSIDAKVSAFLCRGDPGLLTHESPITVAGYPDYGHGKGLYCASGNVAMLKTQSAVRFVVPSVPIAKGNSGGPILNNDMRVVAVCAKGVSHLAVAAAGPADDYGGIFISHLDQLLQVTQPSESAAAAAPNEFP